MSQTVKLGTSVVIAPLHIPAVLAKRVSTIDNLSGGRMVLGLGIGWQREEYEAVGVPFRQRGPAPPLRLLRDQGQHTHYWLYYQDVGPAEAEYERDPRATLRRLLYSGSGDAPAI